MRGKYHIAVPSRLLINQPTDPSALSQIMVRHSPLSPGPTPGLTPGFPGANSSYSVATQSMKAAGVVLQTLSASHAGYAVLRSMEWQGGMLWRRRCTCRSPERSPESAQVWVKWEPSCTCREIPSTLIPPDNATGGERGIKLEGSSNIQPGRVIVHCT